MLPTLEEYVEIDEATVAISGRIDARLGNAIVEFKVDLDSDLGQAEQQLKKYITAIWTDQGPEQSSYLIASDGINCHVYIPELNENDDISRENINLRQVNVIALDSGDPDDVFTKLDRYLLFSEDLTPTAENIVMDFGPTSPICREGLELLEEEWEDDSRISEETPS